MVIMKFPWIDLDRNSLAHAGAIVRYRNGFPARTSDGTDSALEESRRMNPPEMRVLDGEEFGCTRNVSEIHGSILPQRTASSHTGGMVRDDRRKSL